MTTSPRSSNLRSVLISPVNPTISLLPPIFPNFLDHSSTLCETTSSNGSIIIAREFVVFDQNLKSANSAQIVLPLPVGAPMMTLSSEV